MQASLFSTYSTGENRVTGSILGVLKYLALGRIERLLGALLEESEFELVHFQNQPAKGGQGIPDAVISSSCRILIETKIRRDAVDVDQIRRHLKRLDGREAAQLVLLLTPDESRPRELEALKDEKRLAWASFASLDQAIDDLLADTREVVSEREAFLLRHLQVMLVEENLLGAANDVLVIPARIAWDDYHSVHAYVCQPERPFQRVKRLAFYSAGQIQPLIPSILDSYESVVFERGRHSGRLREIVEHLLDDGSRQEGSSQKVLLLSAPNDQQTLKLAGPVVNDLKSESGRTIAFTQNQRYVPLARLKVAKTTSELVG